MSLRFTPNDYITPDTGWGPARLYMADKMYGEKRLWVGGIVELVPSGQCIVRYWDTEPRTEFVNHEADNIDVAKAWLVMAVATGVAK